MPMLQVKLLAGSNHPVTQEHCRSAGHQKVVCKITAKILFLHPLHTCTAAHTVGRVVSVFPSKHRLPAAHTGPKVTLCLYPLYFSLVRVGQLLQSNNVVLTQTISTLLLNLALKYQIIVDYIMAFPQ